MLPVTCPGEITHRGSGKVYLLPDDTLAPMNRLRARPHGSGVQSDSGKSHRPGMHRQVDVDPVDRRPVPAGATPRS